MKNLLTLLIVGGCLTAGVEALGQEQVTVMMKPEVMFTPKGFNNNNNAQAVISGSFGSFCQQVAPAKVRIDKINQRIYVQNNVYMTLGCADALVYIPYSEVLNFGALPVGNYEILTADRSGVYSKQANLPIAQAVRLGEGHDDYLYAPVTDALVEFKEGEADPTLTLKGVFSDKCLSLKNIQVNITEGNVVEVLPFASFSVEKCGSQAVTYSTSIVLAHFPKDRALVHIRSMNGQSINKVITTLDRIPRF